MVKSLKKQYKSWKKIPGYFGIYRISEYGEVVNLFTGRISGFQITPQGYKRVRLTKFGENVLYRVNRLVALTYLPNPDNKPEVGHIDGNKLNNHVSNLAWSTNIENKEQYSLIKYGRFLKIKQLTMEGKHIATFKSPMAAMVETGISNKNLAQVARGIRPSAGGYLWQYVTKEESDAKEEITKNH